MRKFRLAVLVTGLLVLGCTKAIAATSGCIGEAKSAPELLLTSVDGKLTKLSDYSGNTVILHFWSSYRDYTSDLQLLQRLQLKYKEDNVIIIGVAFNSGSHQQVEQILLNAGATFTNLMADTEALRAFDVATYPTTFLINGSGSICHWIYGILEWGHWTKKIETEVL